MFWLALCQRDWSIPWPSMKLNQTACSSRIYKGIAVKRISADPTEPGGAYQRINARRRVSVKGKEENIGRHEEQEGARIRRPQLAAGGAHQRRHYKQQAQKQKQKQKRVIKKLEETKSKITKNTRGERRKESKRWKKKHLIARAERKRKQDMEEEGQLQE